MIDKNDSQKENQSYSKDFKEKLLFMRHGKTYFNSDKDKISRLIDPKYPDCRLCPKGIEQAKSIAKMLNSLTLEKVYVSPLYRALETLNYCLEKYPNKENIIVIVHPLVSEGVNSINDFILDIKQTKKDFNINSNIKIDWSVFDKYIKETQYDENFYYFNNIDCLEEKEKNKIYHVLKNYYDNGDIQKLRNGLSDLAKLSHKKNKRLESLKHMQERFKKFCDYIREKHLDTLNDKNEKILVISHCAFMKIGTDMTPYQSEKINEFHSTCYSPINCEIISYKL